MEQSQMPLRPEFQAVASKMHPIVHGLVVQNADPSALTVDALMSALQSDTQLSDSALRDWKRAAAKSFDVMTVPNILSPAACAALRKAVDCNQRTIPDTVDHCPEHQLMLYGLHRDLQALIGVNECERLLELPREYQRREQAALKASRHGMQMPGKEDDDFEPFMPFLMQQPAALAIPGALSSGEKIDRTDGELDNKDGSEAVHDAILEEAFVRRYSRDTRPWNPFHQDGFRLTVNVALSADAAHSGGRLIGVYDNKVHRMERTEGEATVHSSDLVHAVSSMSGNGVRYSLILFFSIPSH